MKQIVTVILFTTVFNTSVCFAGKYTSDCMSIAIINCNGITDTIVPYLTSLDLNYYKNKPVDSFLTVLPTMYNSIVVQSLGNLKYARIIKVKYPENVRVLIFVKNFQYMNPRSETSHWDINLFKKENLACIEIWHGNNRVTTQCKYWE
jgi:hypothetical protein